MSSRREKPTDVARNAMVVAENLPIMQVWSLPLAQPAAEPAPVAVQSFLALPAPLTEATHGLPAAALELLTQAAAHLAAPCYLYELPAGRVAWFNARFAEIFGATLCFSELVHPDDESLLARRSERLASLRDGEVLTSSWRLHTTSGQWCNYRLQEAVLSRGAAGEPRLAMGLAQDAPSLPPAGGKARRTPEPGLERIIQMAADSARSLAAERAQRRLFETALAHVPLATAILDGLSLSIRWANHAFADFVDEPYRRAEMAGLRLVDVMGHASTSGLIEIVRKVATTHRPCADLRYVYRDQRSGARYWRFTLQPLAGDSAELMLHVEDVTGNVRGERALAA